MSLFRFGFQRATSSSSEGAGPSRGVSLPDHMPAFEESGLGMVEFESATLTVSDLADPTPTKKRRLRGTYTHYSPRDRAKIGQYALENGNEKARILEALFGTMSKSQGKHYQKFQTGLQAKVGF